MQLLRASLAAILCALLCIPSTFAQNPSAVTSPKTPRPRKPYRSDQLQGDQRILQALSRFTFGPRPGDLEAVRSMGLEKWFAQQLHPGAIDNSALEAELAQFPAMRLSTQDLLYRLPNATRVRQVANGKEPIPANAALHAIYANEIARYQDHVRQKKPQEPWSMAGSAASAQAPEGRSLYGGPSRSTFPAGMQAAPLPVGGQLEPEPKQSPNADAASEPSQAQVARILAIPPAPRIARLAAMPEPEFDRFRKLLDGQQKLQLTAAMTPAQKEFVAALEDPQRVVRDELIGQRLTRDIASNAQLQEVMTDFWLNHFNVYLRKNDETPYYLVSYERDVIRPLALGKFEDLLEATAHSPAMLLYLDNSTSIGPDSPVAERTQAAANRNRGAKKAAAEGLNENYARELMELHTLGVNGGYTQTDVTQVARVLTGWTVDHPERGGGFKFDETRHEPGVKKVLGKKLKEHGEQEGRQLLHMLASRPATASFIARELANRFVGDDPPQPLVDRMAKSYLSSDGNISSVLKTLFHSPELWTTEAYRAKIKTPLELVVSAARASNATVDNVQQLANALRDMGMPLYGSVPPTGYKWDAADWVSTGALVDRMNFALALAANKLPGIAVDWNSGSNQAAIPSQAAPANSASQPVNSLQPKRVSIPSAPPTDPLSAGPESEEQKLEAWLIPGGVSASTRAALLEQFSSQMQARDSQPQASAKETVASGLPVDAGHAAGALERQHQLLAGLLLGSPEFQRR